jgi:hypothetical protein
MPNQATMRYNVLYTAPFALSRLTSGGLKKKLHGNFDGTHWQKLHLYALNYFTVPARRPVQDGVNAKKQFDQDQQQIYIKC